MYWNASFVDYKTLIYEINYNMRCIETLSILLKFIFINDKLQHEMYWNLKNGIPFCIKHFDKLQHEMYWNQQNIVRFFINITDKLQHEMYWN